MVPDNTHFDVLPGNGFIDAYGVDMMLTGDVIHLVVAGKAYTLSWGKLPASHSGVALDMAVTAAVEYNYWRLRGDVDVQTLLLVRTDDGDKKITVSGGYTIGDPTVADAVAELYEEYANIFGNDDLPTELPPKRNVQHRIRTTFPIPRGRRPYRMSAEQEQALQKQVK